VEYIVLNCGEGTLWYLMHLLLMQCPTWSTVM